MEIPLLAQFIVCTRQMLANIMIFQDTMIVTEEMAEYGHDWMEEEHEEEMYHQNNEYEHQRDAIEEKKRKRDDHLTDFWNHMVDKFHDKES